MIWDYLSGYGWQIYIIILLDPLKQNKLLISWVILIDSCIQGAFLSQPNWKSPLSLQRKSNLIRSWQAASYFYSIFFLLLPTKMMIGAPNGFGPKIHWERNRVIWLP